MVCDLTLASKEHARFKQNDADVASFDGDLVRPTSRVRSAKSVLAKFLLGAEYSAQEAYEMGMVNWFPTTD